MTSSLALRTTPPIPGTRVADQRVLDVLLGDRRPALQVAAEDVVLEGAGEAGEREAGIGIEVTVLGGHHRVAHVHRNLVDVDVDAIAFRRNDFRQLTAVAGQDRRHLVGADVARLGHVDDEVGHRERDDRQHDQHGHRGVQPAAHPLPVDLRGGSRASAPVAALRGGPPPPGGRRGGGRRWLLRRRRRAVQCCLDDVDRVTQMRRRWRRAPPAAPRSAGRRVGRRRRRLPGRGGPWRGRRSRWWAWRHTISRASRADITG